MKSIKNINEFIIVYNLRGDGRNYHWKINIEKPVNKQLNYHDKYCRFGLHPISANSFYTIGDAEKDIEEFAILNGIKEYSIKEIK